MSWRDQLLPASFRGVAFEVLRHDSKTGRRVVVEEYPERNLPGYQDLGNRLGRYQLEAFVLGDDYISARNDLLDALEQSGPGELVHPWLGRLWVHADESSYSEDSSEGGMCRFNLVFLERAQIERIEALDASKTAGSATAAAQAATAAATAESLALDAEVALLPPGLRRLYSAQQTIHEAAIASLLRVDSLGDDVEAAVYGAVNTYSLAMQVASWYFPALIGANSLVAAAWAAWQRRIVLPALRVAIEVSLGATYTTADDAQARADALVELLEAQEDADDAPHDLLVQIRALRSVVVEVLLGVASTLPRLTSIEVTTPIPAFVLAFDRYGSTDRESDILARNEIPHPGFCSGTLSVPTSSADAGGGA